MEIVEDHDQRLGLTFPEQEPLHGVEDPLTALGGVEGLNGFETTYFKREKTWDGLARCCRVAEAIRDGRGAYEYLAVAQLIKHALGLTKKCGQKGFRPLYLWYRWPGAEADRHAAELERFRGAVGQEINFDTRTYQEVFAALQRARGEHADYVRYLEERYFSRHEQI